MSDILCKWLNEEVRISLAIEPNSLDKNFSNGYLFGEVLFKYQLQKDFNMFTNKDTSVSKLNNFARLEPSLHLLGIPFDTNKAQAIIQEKQGVATHLLYQLYFSLGKKKKAQVRGIMQPTVIAGLHKKDHDICCDVCMDCQIVQNEISQFETNRKKLVTYISTSSSTNHQDLGVSGKETRITLQSNDKFIRDIRKRLDENAVAREQREKRLQRFMIEQMKAREAQEETRRDEQLVRRLTRQTQHEQRLAAQLLQICRQKEVILENRLFREEQYRQRREKDLQEALEWEAALAQQVKLERVEEMKKELEICKKISAERAQNKYKKHFAICKDIVEQMIDFATKVGEYHQLTENLIPEKQIRVWKEMLLKGLPLYYLNVQKPGFEFFTPLDPVEQKRQDILNDLDYEDYASMVGEWALPNDEGEPLIPLTNNNILGHIVSRLRNFRCQPKVAPSSPPLPPFKLKACVLGKFCSGKTTCLSKISKAHGIYILSADTLIAEALNAYEIGEISKESTTLGQRQIIMCIGLLKSVICVKRSIPLSQPSTRALQGAAIQAKLKEGQTISTELLLDIIVHAIRQVPTQSCWILDGFPADVAQAHMLEKALGGICEDPVESITINLVADPNPPKPPSPPAPVLDLVVLLDIPDECVVQRAFSHIGTVHCSWKNIYVFTSPTHGVNRWCSFQEAWPKLEKWFDKKQNILVRVDADADEEELYKRLECVLQRAMMQIPEGQWSLFLSSFSNWEYVDDPLPTGIPEKLCSHWDTMCCSYVNNITTVMQQFRSQNTIISHHLNNIREDYQQFLKRPDLKQESVSRWQKDFNSIPDDMRQDEETKAELHLRLDELCECLWDISNKRKMEDEKEMSAVMGEGFLEEHTALLVNNHSMLMQVELQRFQTTMSVLKVYYLSMSNQLLPEMPFKMSPIPLLDTTKIEGWYFIYFFYLLFFSIEQLADVTRHHIEAANKLQHEVVLVCNDSIQENHCTFIVLSIKLDTQLTGGFPFLISCRSQFLEIVALLTDEYELLDWRRFLLCAALPWPIPSSSQLLVVLQHIKSIDAEHTGYINETEYLQTELWFSSESVQPVPEDPSEPLPYDRPTNLRKFFFRLFADHSFSPPELDYVSMLQYLAAHPNPRQGFIRALSVVLGQHIRYPSPNHLVKNLLRVFRELQYGPEDCVPFSVLSQHPFIQSLIENSTRHQLVVLFLS
uniref:Sperm flagellar 2 n=1 Tax=Takifugu rubripes TaxID=31033 RepID=A0A674MJM5_TAKRU